MCMYVFVYLSVCPSVRLTVYVYLFILSATTIHTPEKPLAPEKNPLVDYPMQFLCYRPLSLPLSRPLSPSPFPSPAQIYDWPGHKGSLCSHSVRATGELRLGPENHIEQVQGRQLEMAPAHRKPDWADNLVPCRAFVPGRDIAYTAIAACSRCMEIAWVVRLPEESK